MNEPSKAVFLSYASQDAEAARKICEALRSTGVEVWFDQSELRGGDAWDSKIRKQIKECALFVPIISANTQARREGYFRIEWKLAAQRTHGIAEGTPFLMPLLIDKTSEADALVPAEFRDVQWSSIGDAGGAESFCTRVKQLLTGATVAGAAQPASVSPRPATTAPRRRALTAIAVTLVALLAAIALWQPWKKQGAAAPAASLTVSPAGAPESLPRSRPEVQRLVERVWELYERQNEATRDDWALAEELGAQATQIDPADGEAAAAYAQATLGSFLYGFNTQAPQLAAALKRAEKAVALAPESVEARLSLANCMRIQNATRSDAERIVREVLARHPTSKHAWRVLANTLRYQGRNEEALAAHDRANALPGGDANALAAKGVIYLTMGRLDLMERALDEQLVVQPVTYAWLKKAVCALYLRGDFGEAAAAIEKAPGTFLFRDEGALIASQVHLWNGQPERALAILRSVGQEWLDARRVFNYFSPLATAPTAFLVGQAHAVAGRNDAAQVQWEAALTTIEGLLKREPTNPEYLWWRARLLACLGQKLEAERSLRGFQETVGSGTLAAGTNLAGTTPALAFVWMPLGQEEKVLAQAVALAGAPIHPAAAMFHLGFFRHDPTFAAVRQHPDFQALLRHLEKMAASAPREK